jgi:hypothetical protein
MRHVSKFLLLGVLSLVQPSIAVGQANRDLDCPGPGCPSSWFSIQNESGESIRSVQVVGVGASGWGSDLLGSFFLPDGQSATFEYSRNQGYCRFDIRVILESGREVVMKGENLCEVTKIVIDGPP